MMKRTGVLLSLLALFPAAALPAAGNGQGSRAGPAPPSVTLMSWYTETQFTQFTQGFQKETGTKIDLYYVPPVQQYVDKFMVLTASSQIPDVFFICAENKQDVIGYNLAEDLSSMPVFRRIPAAVSAKYGKDGKIFGYAPEAWISGVFYNKDIFSRAGISKIPLTWDEFIEACRKIKALGVEPIVSPADDVHSIAQSLYSSMVISRDPANDQKINRGRTTFTATYTRPLQIWYNELCKPGLFSRISLGLNEEQVIDMFAAGRCAMFGGGPWHIALIRERNPALDYGILQFGDKGGNRVLGGALNVGLSISASSDKTDAAFKFLDYMARDENIKKWQRDVTGMILVVSGIDYEVGNIFDQCKEDAVRGNFYLPQMEWDNSAAIFKELLTGVQDVMTGADIIENVPRRLDAKMKELND
jgi:raffinose/stachyose/melibiose transport system substrate-binding protein